MIRCLSPVLTDLLLAGHADCYYDFFLSLFFEIVSISGPMIIQAICDRLGLSQSDVSSAWNVLRNYGNMSSATLIFVLDEMRKSPMNGKWVPAIAFGPGLNVEGIMLREADRPAASTADCLPSTCLTGNLVSVSPRPEGASPGKRVRFADSNNEQKKDAGKNQTGFNERKERELLRVGARIERVQISEDLKNNTGLM